MEVNQNENRCKGEEAVKRDLLRTHKDCPRLPTILKQPMCGTDAIDDCNKTDNERLGEDQYNTWPATVHIGNAT
jgi:hypothetical protein